MAKEKTKPETEEAEEDTEEELPIGPEKSVGSGFGLPDPVEKEDDNAPDR